MSQPLTSICDNWIAGVRCRRPGEVYLYGPDGTRVPGGPICQQCADACIAEYRDGLGEEWTSQPIGGVSR